MRARPFFAQAGISLIEALVALAVMAFGVLGVVGLQATMRQNADVSKQRSEAVRIAQEHIEEGRAFSMLELPVGASSPAPRDFASFSSAESTGQQEYTTNTSFTVNRTVESSTLAGMKTITVLVKWTDRMNVEQRVQLSTSVAGIAPESAAARAVPPPNDNVLRLPQGRNPVIPLPAVDATDKRTSSFSPVEGVRWVFNNLTGVITSICNLSVCTSDNFNALLLSGYVRFGANGTTTEAISPTALAKAVDLQVLTTFPTDEVIACYSRMLSTAVAYYCALPISVDSTPGLVWSGKLDLVSSTTLPIASTAADAATAHYRVCRYTPSQDDTPPNVDHPLRYVQVKTGLSLQNFLVIPAGDGTTPSACPTDTTNTLANTRPHQP